MGLCRSKFWLIVFSLFTIWSVLIFFNYSSLINSVAFLAKFYVYSVDYEQKIQIISNPNDTSSSSTLHSDHKIIDTRGNTEDGTVEMEENVQHIVEKPRVNVGDVEEDEIDKLLNVNITDIVEQSDYDKPRIALGEANSDQHLTVVEESIGETKGKTQQKRPRERRKKGKSKGKKSKRLPINTQKQTSDTSSNQESRAGKAGEVRVSPSPPPPPPLPPPKPPRQCLKERTSEPQSCSGRYVFIQTLPRRFNVDLLRDCKNLDLWMNMCEYVKNLGLGPVLPNSARVFSENGWFATNQFLLEVIFHNRMKQYDCLTDDSSKASAIFVPFYAGLDVARHLWNTDSYVRDSSGFELVKLLKRKPEWKRWWGRDHFFIGGRITWDFRRSANSKDPDWGTKFLYLPEVKNMTGLVIESSPWNNNDFGIPYPTYFHPANDEEVFLWQDRMRNHKRNNLFCFAGAPRPDRPDSIRNQLISQCEESKKCMMIHCNNWNNKCHNPAELMKIFQSSDFCLQPPGDSYTRRSTFDSILAGCIPVFFHPGSAYIQYLWHFPKEFTKYSVFISMYDIRDGKANVQRVLESIPAEKIDEMKDEIIKLIPKIIYADPRCRLETLDDAFDVSVKGVLERVTRIKEDIAKGRDDSFGYDESQAWKYRWLGRLEEHEWDPYFTGSFDTRNFTNF